MHQNECQDIFKSDKKHKASHPLMMLISIHRSRDISIHFSIKFKTRINNSSNNLEQIMKMQTIQVFQDPINIPVSIKDLMVIRTRVKVEQVTF